MLNSIVQFFSPLRQLQVPLVGLLLASGMWAGEAKPSPSNQLEPAAMSAPASNAPRGEMPKKDGVYLYGRSSQPEQLGQEYMVFEVHQGKVIGAVYMPRSEFSCFHGTLESGKLALMVTSSPDAEAYSDPVAGQTSQKVATASSSTAIGNGYNSSAYPYSVALQSYHQLSSVSVNDQKLLRACKANN